MQGLWVLVPASLEVWQWMGEVWFVLGILFKLVSGYAGCGCGGSNMQTSGLSKPPSSKAYSNSWVVLFRESSLLTSTGTPPTPVPFCTTTDYLNMLKEAQKESSAHSSIRVSPIYSLSSTGRNSPNSPISTPKSPPNSPNTELAGLEDKLSLQGVFINRDPQLDFLDSASSSSLAGSHSKVWSISNSKYSKKKAKSVHLPLTLVMTHILALGLGFSLGIWLLRRRGGAGL